jgi:hypothetical protein
MAFDEEGSPLEGISSSKIMQPVVTLGGGRIAVYFPGNDLHGDPFSTRFESDVKLIVMDYGEKRISIRDCYNEQHQPQLPEGGKILQPIEEPERYRQIGKMC